MENEVTFSDLLGKTIEKIHGEAGDDDIIIDTAEGNSYRMYHSQDCCEHVSVEDIVGDVKDIIGSPILLAEEVSQEEDPEGYPERDYSAESQTWTFYKLSTIKGSITIRFYGSSNGYYSERVQFVEI